jgi:hypothetical protein
MWLNFDTTTSSTAFVKSRADSGRVSFPPGVDPSLAYTAIYLQFFTYFLAEDEAMNVGSLLPRASPFL